MTPTGGLSNSVRSAVSGYAAEVLCCAADRVGDVTAFESGNRHAVFKVSCIGASLDVETVVVRLCLADDAAERAQAEREARVLETLGGVGAPLLHDFRPVSSWFETPAMCVEFVAGRPHDLTSAGAEALRRLGTVLCSVHESGSTALDGWLDRPSTLRSYAEARLHAVLSARELVREPLPPAIRDRLHAAIDAVDRSADMLSQTARFATDEAAALLHGDPVADNVLWSPDPVLIDWEYARLGDPADEIAYVFDQSELSARQRAAFWAGYRERSSIGRSVSDIAGRVAWWEPVTLLGSTMWWVQRWMWRETARAAARPDLAVPRGRDYYRQQVVRRLDRLDRLLASGGSA